ncbi:Short-chain dehydrogenase/reductase SDR, partial [Trinorchestia longiramus]
TLWSLINNAGIAIYADIEIAPMDHYKKVMDVNAFGPVRMCKAILPLLRANQRGRIVNVTSMSG